MPTGSTVERVYEALRRKNYPKGKAARIAQSQTGEALATGRAPAKSGRPKHPLKAANAPVVPKPPRPEEPDLTTPSSQRAGKPPLALADNEEPQVSPGMQILLGLREARAQAQSMTDEGKIAQLRERYGKSAAGQEDVRRCPGCGALHGLGGFCPACRDDRNL